MFRQSSTASSRSALRSSKPSLRPLPPATQGIEPLNPLLPLQGCIVSYTGFSVAEREVVNTKVRAMGGEINVDLTEDVTHLLVAKVGSQKYKVAYSLGIPVLSPSWLNKLYERWCKKDTFDLKTLTEEHILGPLTGCNICVTGYAADVREEIERNTLKYGGKYTSDLHRGKTTHLLCHRATGLKYKSAMMWGLHCVPYDWLKDSIKNLERADESNYQILSSAPTHGAGAEAKAPISLDMDTDPVKPQSVQDQMYLDACYIYLSLEFSTEMAVRLKKMIRMGGGIQVAEYQPSEVTHVVVPSNVLDARTLALFNQDIDLPYIVNFQWLRQSNRACKLLPESEYIVPFPTRSEDGQQKPARFQGATTWTTDSAFKSSDLNSNRTSNRSGTSVNLAVDSNNDSISSNDKLTAGGGKSMEYRSASDKSAATTPSASSDTPENDSSVGLRRGLRSRTQSGMLTEALGELSVVTTTQMPSQDKSLVSKTGLLALEEDGEEEESAKSSIFLGLYISAYGWSSQKLVSAIHSETVAHGGVFVDEGETPPVSLDRIWTIVPLSRSLQSLAHLKTVVLTGCWFERSLQTDRVVPRNEHFLNTPIPVLPVPGFEGLNIAVATTLLKEYEYEQIGKAIGHMGATFCNKLNNLTTNLLIADKAIGPKYEFMAKKGKPIVKMRWLQDCIQQGTRLPYDNYILENPSMTGMGSVIKRSDSDLRSMRPSSTTNSRSNSPFENQLVPVYHAAPSDRPLEGLVIYLHGRVQGDHNEMQDLIAQMGARLLTSFNSSATHFIHQGKRTLEVGKEIKMATKHRIFTVSPRWLYKCHETGIRVKESEYREIYDGNHLQTHVISASQPSGASKAGHRGLSKPASSPSLLTSASTSHPGRTKRSSTATSASQFRGNESSSTQSLHRTAAAVTSSVAVKREMSSVNVTPSLSTSNFDMSIPLSTTDQPSLRSMPSAQSFPAVQEESRSFMEDSEIWQPLPKVPVIREERKRRRVSPPEEGSSSSTTTPATTSEMDGDHVDYFSKASKYGPDAIYWDDVEGRQKKRALYESLGYTIPENSLASNDESDTRQESLPRDMASQAPRQYNFLLTGILQPDRPRFKRTIHDLGGVVLEDVSEDHDEWKAKVTHLVANGKNPPRTAKLVAAKEVGAMIVHKSFLIESAEQGHFVDEMPHLI